MPKELIADLRAAGFKQIDQPYVGRDGADMVFSKWAVINGHRAFCVIVKRYSHAEHTGFEADVQFNIHGNIDQPVFNVLLLHVHNPEQIMSFFTDIWTKLGCASYDS